MSKDENNHRQDRDFRDALTEQEIEYVRAHAKVSIEKLLDDYRQKYLRDWQAASEHALRGMRSERATFAEHIQEIWGEALDEYDTVVEVADYMGWSISKRWFKSAIAIKDDKTLALIELHTRCRRIAREVSVLLSTGFAAGAHARSRTLHELAVVALFIKQNPVELARRYRAFPVIERLKFTREYNNTIAKTHQHRGYEPHTEEDVAELSRQRDVLVERYGSTFASYPYGWAASAIGKKKPNFRDLETALGMNHLRPFYSWSSQDVHPGPHGNNLNYLERGDGSRVLAAGMSDIGLADPANGAMVSLSQVTTALCMPIPERDSPKESCIVENVLASCLAEVQALHDLVENAQQTFANISNSLTSHPDQV